MIQRESHDADIRADVVKAIEEAFPNDVVDMMFDPDESHLADVYPKLRRKLSKVKGANLLYERAPDGGPGWAEQRRWYDDELDELDDFFSDGLSSSYYLFFVGLSNDRYKWGVELEALVEDPSGEDVGVEVVQGAGTAGCAVGVSMIAPFATIMFESMDHYEDGTFSYPDVQGHVYDTDGEAVDMEDYFRERLSKKGFQALDALRGKVAKILESFGFSVLPDEELQRAVSWLEADDEALVGPALTGEDITVKDAFFFRGP